jgi:hypothetical protein
MAAKRSGPDTTPGRSPTHSTGTTELPVTVHGGAVRGLNPARFGQPSTYSLTPWELARHVRDLRRQGWQSWEVRARFGWGQAA